MSNEPSPTTITRPTSTSEVSAIVCDAVQNSRRIRIRSAIPKGLKPNEDVDNISLGNMNSVVDYPARDMTITVEAGMTMQKLAGILQAENQQLPIDSFDAAATVGSVVAGDVAGPRQYGYGTIRDYVIGIEAVDGQGRIFHSGGRVVKNVAGYDLCRLMVGSRGMLGVVTQVTFKLKPIPQQSMLRVFRFEDANNFKQALERLNTSNATPVVLDFTYATAELVASKVDKNSDRTVPYSLTIGVEGTEASCRWQISQLKEECVGGEEISFDDHPGWSVAQHCHSWGYGWKEPKLTCVPSKVVAIAKAFAAKGYVTVGHVGSGQLFPTGQPDNHKLRQHCDEIASLHSAIATEWDVDHPGNSKDELTARLRNAFDPNCVFIQ